MIFRTLGKRISEILWFYVYLSLMMSVAEVISVDSSSQGILFVNAQWKKSTRVSNYPITLTFNAVLIHFLHWATQTRLHIKGVLTGYFKEITQVWELWGANSLMPKLHKLNVGQFSAMVVLMFSSVTYHRGTLSNTEATSYNIFFSQNKQKYDNLLQ